MCVAAKRRNNDDDGSPSSEWSGTSPTCRDANNKISPRNLRDILVVFSIFCFCFLKKNSLIPFYFFCNTQILIESGGRATEFEELPVDPGVTLLPDMLVDANGEHIYTISTSKVIANFLFPPLYVSWSPTVSRHPFLSSLAIKLDCGFVCFPSSLLLCASRRQYDDVLHVRVSSSSFWSSFLFSLWFILFFFFYEKERSTYTTTKKEIIIIITTIINKSPTVRVRTYWRYFPD